MTRYFLRASAVVLALGLPLAGGSVANGQVPAAPPPAVPNCPELASALQALMRNDARLRDWPQLGRYREANRLLGPPAGGQARIVFMGDSITDLWQQPRHGALFQERSYVNRGISGQTTAQMLVRFRPDVIDLKPSVVVILAGVNDIAGNTGPATNEEIQGNLASMSELARAAGIRVVLASILPVSEYHTAPGATPQTTIRPMARIRAMNDWIRAYAAANRHVHLEYFSAMTDDAGLLRRELSADDLHPNERGYAVMAPLARAAVAAALQ